MATHVIQLKPHFKSSCNAPALSGTTQGRALNLLVLLLPAEQRATLRELLRLVTEIVARQDTNKMTEHNVAMIIAPTLFPPRYISLLNLTSKVIHLVIYPNSPEYLMVDQVLLNIFWCLSDLCGF